MSPSDKAEFDSTMFDLFCVEIETQCINLNQALIEIERTPKDQKLIESLMRAAHSIKGAARVLNLDPIVRLAHAMEDCLVAARQGEMSSERINQLFHSVDLLTQMSKVKLKEFNAWLGEHLPFIENLIAELSAFPKPIASIEKKEAQVQGILPQAETKKVFQTSVDQDRILRITAENLNRLMGLVGEYLIESRWLSPFAESLQEFKNKLMKIGDAIYLLKDSIKKEYLNEIAQQHLTDVQYQIHVLYVLLNERLGEMDDFIRRHASLSDRLYQEVINSRMRPFGDGVEALPRMVRDLAHQLGKRVRLEIEGKSTLVDREILEKLESPLSHLLRNAIDHGIELPEERKAAGKSEEGVIKLEAHHRGGMLAITISDDGRGIDIEKLRHKIVEKKLINAEIANRLTDSELLDFLFLPGFSTSVNLTEISGRGIGLNIVQSTLQEIGGVVRTLSSPGKGMSFYLQLPLTLSVIHALLVSISGEVYAFPLAHIDQAFLVPRENIQLIENRQFFYYEGENIGIIPAWMVLDLNEPEHIFERLPLVVFSERLNIPPSVKLAACGVNSGASSVRDRSKSGQLDRGSYKYGLIVDCFIGEKELVVQNLDSRLGKIPNISAGALMEDGSPILIVDVEDIIRSIENLLSGARSMQSAHVQEAQTTASTKRILVVDDSLTVREVECRLLLNKGYQVETAVNGVDAWNAIRLYHYDLVITDIDMPRMNGIELSKAIKSNPKLQHLPVMIVSYKEGEEERLKGLEAGADYYLTKSSFHDTTLIDAVKGLIGNP
jgi:two-component system sensor histidine kinase and response regulator WspE